MADCGECGFSYDRLPSDRIAPSIRQLAETYPETLLRPGVSEVVAVRPAPDTWSMLVYCCHVRDVLLVQRDRVVLALVEEDPSFPRMYRDERVDLAGYRREAPGDVVRGVVMAADLLARVFEERTPEELGRRCLYNYPSAAERDIAWLGRHAVHEERHHLQDVRSVLEQVGAPQAGAVPGEATPPGPRPAEGRAPPSREEPPVRKR